MLESMGSSAELVSTSNSRFGSLDLMGISMFVVCFCGFHSLGIGGITIVLLEMESARVMDESNSVRNSFSGD